jgi:polyhydroxybutyrate depolymerase
MKVTRRLIHLCANLVLVAACSQDAVGWEAEKEAQAERPADCPLQPLTAGDHTFQITSANGFDYSYILSIPKTVDPKRSAPVLVYWHPGNSDPEEVRAADDIDASAEAEGLIVVYPRSPDKGWNVKTACCLAQLFGIPQRDEMVFARELVADVKSKVCVDESRVYSSGMSNGGAISHMVACELADVFAAVAPTGSVLTIPPGECKPTRPISILLTSGTADTFAGYREPSPLLGGISAVDTVPFWVAANQCVDEPETFVQEGMARCQRHTQCAGGAEVAYCVVEGMGHCVPGMRKESQRNCVTKAGTELGMPNDDIDGTQLDLDFLLGFALP